MAAWNAGELLALSGKYWETCTLHAGVKLDVFSEIGNREVGAGELAQRLEFDLRGMETLLNGLSAMKLLIKKADRYANTPEGLTFLVKDSPRYIGFMIMHHHHLVEPWSRLDEAARTGQSVGKSVVRDDKTRESFLMGMFKSGHGHCAPGFKGN